MLKSGIIYRATSPSGKVYIGQTIQSLRKRKAGHKSQALHQDYKWCRAIRKYGIKKFEWEILHKKVPFNILGEMEQIEIEIHNSFYKGYNSTIGGKARECLKGKVVSEKTKRKISEAHKGKKISIETKQLLSNIVKEAWRTGKRVFVPPKDLEQARKRKSIAQKGKHPSEETRKNMAMAHIGKKHSEETKQKMSEAQNGEKHSQYGTHRTKETKEKISKARKGKRLGSQNYFYDQKHTQKSRKKMSIAQYRRSKVNPKIANAIRKLYSPPKYTQKVLAQYFNINQATVSRILANKYWQNEQEK